MFKGKIELFFHLIFWAFILFSVNVEWASSWFDVSSRPNTPAPLSVIIFPIYFYVNAFLLIPKYFSFEKWKHYLFYSFILFILPEIFRVFIYLATFSENNFESELFSRDSFLFGAPSPFFFAINTSFIYRLGKDWLMNKRRLKEFQTQKTKPLDTKPYEGSTILNPEESAHLKDALNTQIKIKEVFLNPEITLRELAEKLETTEKKLSYLINQELKSSFYELLNHHRILRFKKEVEKAENKNLSIVGLALNCGFPSKSSFYRAFKAQVGVSPSEYIKSLKGEK